MLKTYAQQWIELGEDIADATIIWSLDANFDAKNGASGEKRLNRRGRDELRTELKQLLDVAQKLDLPVSQKLLVVRLAEGGNLPATVEEFEMLAETLKAEIESKLFFFVPSHRAKYYDLILPSIVTMNFPLASQEMVLAGNCIATDCHTASVFHSMRAVEIGLQAMATSLGVAFSYPLALAEWGKIVGEIEPKINEFKLPPRSAEKDADLEFYSEAASQFRHFNNAWRIRVAHARASYQEHQAMKVFDYTLNFFQTLSLRLKEPPA